MARFLVESPISEGADALDAACELARRVGDDRVVYVRTTFLPGTATVLHLFEAPSVRALALAGRRAGLPYDHIVAATDDATDREENSSNERT